MVVYGLIMVLNTDLQLEESTGLLTQNLPSLSKY